MLDHLDARITYDQNDVTAAVSRFGVLGFGSTLDEAIADLLVEMNAKARRMLAATDRYRLAPEELDLLRLFVQSSSEEQKAMLSRELS